MVRGESLLRRGIAALGTLDLPPFACGQILRLEWKYLIPISMVLLVGMALLISCGLIK